MASLATKKHTTFPSFSQDLPNPIPLSYEIHELSKTLVTNAHTATVDGERVIGAGLAPLPVQRPIPVWFGAQSPPAYRRAGRLGDGWFPQVPPGPELDQARAVVEQAARDAGRDPANLGMEGRVSWKGSVDQVVTRVEQWRSAGATHLSINTMNAGLSSVDDHLTALDAVSTALGLAST